MVFDDNDLVGVVGVVVVVVGGGGGDGSGPVVFDDNDLVGCKCWQQFPLELCCQVLHSLAFEPRSWSGSEAMPSHSPTIALSHYSTIPLLHNCTISLFHYSTLRIVE